MQVRSLFQKLASVALGVFSLSIGWADQIVMKNGDRITGSVVKKDAKTVTIKTDNFGVVTLNWDYVTSIIVDKPINVVLGDGKAVQGTIVTAGDKVEVTSGGAKQSVPPADVAVLRDDAEQKNYVRMLKPGFTDLWVISANIGLAGTTGNAKTASFTVPANLTRISNTSKTTAYFNYIRASADVAGISTTTAQAVRGGWAYNRNLKPRLFATVFNDYEYDKFQSLDLRSVIGGGLGYIVFKSDRGRLDLVGGGDYNHEKFDPARPQLAFTRNSAEIYWGDDFTFKMNSRASFNQSYRMFNNLSNGGEYRQNFDAGLGVKLAKSLTWNVSFSDRYLSNPAPGRLKNDVLYTTGLGFTLSR